MASWRAPGASAGDHEPLDLAQSQALPPLSPSTARAFCETFRDDATSAAVQADGKREGKTSSSQRKETKLEPEAPPPVDGEAFPSAVPPETMAWAVQNRVRRQPEIMSMSLSEMKEEVVKSAEARRARRSEIEKKSRQRRMGALRCMRREVKQLEDVYSAMLEQQCSSHEGHISPPDWHGVLPKLTERLVSTLSERRSYSTSVNRLEHKYSELTLVAHALKENKARLQSLVQAYETFQRSITADPSESGVSSHLPTVSTKESGQEQSEGPIYDTGVPPSSSWAVPFQKLSITQCYAVVRDAYTAVRRFNESRVFVTTGANYMGWTDKRMLDEESGALRYGFTKQFPLETKAGKLFTRVWESIMDGTRYTQSKFLSTGVLRFQTLQKIGDDMQIVRLDHTHEGSPKTFISLHMDFRVETPTGFVHVMRSVPTPEVKSLLEPHEHLYDVFHWTHFNQLFDDDGLPAGTEVVVCGSLSDKRQMMSERWLFDIALSLLQWESNHISPLFLKLS